MSKELVPIRTIRFRYGEPGSIDEFLNRTGTRTLKRKLGNVSYLTGGNAPLYLAVKSAIAPYSFINVGPGRIGGSTWYLYSSNTIPPPTAPALWTIPDSSVFNDTMMNLAMQDELLNQGLYIYSAMLNANVFPAFISSDILRGRFVLNLDQNNLPAPFFANRYLAIYTTDVFKTLFGFTQDVYSIDTTITAKGTFTAETAPLMGEEIATGIDVKIEGDLITSSIHGTNIASPIICRIILTNDSIPQGIIPYPTLGRPPTNIALNRTPEYQNITIRFVSALDDKVDLIFSNGATEIEMDILTIPEEVNNYHR